MNYICKDCGHIFESGEEVIKHYDGEDWACCPSCGSTEIVDGVRCKDCGSVFDEDELFWGRCKECLLERMADYDLFFEYLTDRDDGRRKVTGLEEFVFTALWGIDEKYVPESSSPQLKAVCKKEYYGLVEKDWIWREHQLYKMIESWMTDNEAFDLCDFAEWLHDRDKEKKVKE